MKTYTLNDATNIIFDSDGNAGVYQDGDAVYESYLMWANAGGILNHVHVKSESNSLQITKLEFMNRLTADELILIYTAAAQDVRLQIWLDKFKISEFVDLSDQQTIDGIKALEQFSIIATGRSLEILS